MPRAGPSSTVLDAAGGDTSGRAARGSAGAIANGALAGASLRDLLLAFFLASAVVLAYAGARSHGFVNFDDGEYVYENPPVTRGLTLDGVRWAFTAVHSANWHPLTWLSHMLDVHLFGLDAGWHHLTNVALHALATVCLFAALRAMRLAPWRSAIVAALFALHPRNVESVAWISERKDVLSAVFWTSAMWAYATYVRRTTWPRYLAVVALFVLGLLAKPMVVTLPAALLLLDVWPLRRLRVADVGADDVGDDDGAGDDVRDRSPARPWGALVLEKVPLFALSLAAAVGTFLAQRSSGAVATLEALPLAFRLQNAAVGYADYLWSLFWPADLAVFYPYRMPLPTAEVAASVLLLIGISALVVRLRRTRPYLLVGWLWYLGTLVPVIGIVKAGEQAMADRFTYLPAIGIFLAVTWAVADAAARHASARRVLAPAAALALLACLLVTREQVKLWRDSVTLFEHALVVTQDNYLAHTNLAAALVEIGRADAAIEHAQAAATLRPNDAKILATLGTTLARVGREDEARAAYQRALGADPDSTLAHLGLGVLFAERQQWTEAAQAYGEVLRREPRHAKAHAGLGFVLASQGRNANAIAEYRAALAIDSRLLQADNGLALALEASGQPDEALRVLASALASAPAEQRLRLNYAAMLLARGRPRDAEEQYRELLRQEPQNVHARVALADVLSQGGRPGEARDELQAAAQAARARGDLALLGAVEERLAALASASGRP